MDRDKYMVATRCMTYNHAPYIEDTLGGFSIQNTTFPVVYMVVDDASTDGEPEIIKKWAKQNLTPSKEGNMWQKMPYGLLAIGTLKGKPFSLFALLLLSENHYQKKEGWKKLKYISEWNESAKYLASCDGDDYWTSPYKLQKQVEILENHPSYSLCVHNYKSFLQKDGIFLPANRHYNEDISFTYETYIANLPTQPHTMMIRSTAYPTLAERRKYKYFRDNHLYYYILKHGPGYYIAEEMGVYRITKNGIWTSLNIIEQKKIDLLCYVELYEHHPEEKEFRKLCIDLYSSYMFLCHINHQKIEKIQCKSLGLMGMIEIYLRYYAIQLHSIIRPELKRRSLVN